MTFRRIWTQEEITFLKRNYGKIYAKDIAKKFGRRKDVVVHKARKIGLLLVKRWTRQETTFIKKNYKKLSIRKMAKILKRSMRGIYHKSERLGLKLPNYKKQLPKSAQKLTVSLSYILGVMIGDGWHNNSRIRLMVKDKDFALNFKKKLEKWSRLKAKIRIVKGTQYLKGFLWEIRLYSVEAVKIIVNYKSEIKDIMLNTSKECQIAFLEGLYDSEGCVLNPLSKEKVISFCNTKKSTVDLTEKLLDNLGIKCKINLNKKYNKKQKDKYVLYVRKKENIIRFHKYIHFSIKRKQKRLERLSK